MHKKINIIERIERHAGELRDDECWETDYRSGNQYGHTYIRGGDWNKMLMQHRVAWEAHNAQPIPEGMLVMHSCDNPSCFNPHHLSLGTHQENMTDKANKGRAPGCISITKAIKLEISQSSPEDEDALIDTYGVSLRYIRNLRKRWARLTEVQRTKLLRND